MWNVLIIQFHLCEFPKLEQKMQTNKKIHSKKEWTLNEVNRMHNEKCIYEMFVVKIVGSVSIATIHRNLLFIICYRFYENKLILMSFVNSKTFIYFRELFPFECEENAMKMSSQGPILNICEYPMLFTRDVDSWDNDTKYSQSIKVSCVHKST